MLVVAPTKLAFAILNELVGRTFTIKASVLEVLTMVAVPFVVLVILFTTLTVS